MSTFNILLLPLALILSGFHLMILLTLLICFPFPKMPAKASVVAALVATNVVYLGCFVSSWIFLIKDGRQSVCVGYNYQCDWFEGTITSRGIVTIGINALLQLLINVVPTIVALANRVERGRSEAH